MKEAEQSFQEALTIRRHLSEANPEVYLPDIAITLNNLGILYSDMQRTHEARDLCNEAHGILEPLWRRNPELHGTKWIESILSPLCLTAPSSNEPDGLSSCLATTTYIEDHRPSSRPQDTLILNRRLTQSTISNPLNRKMRRQTQKPPSLASRPAPNPKKNAPARDNLSPTTPHAPIPTPVPFRTILNNVI